MKMDCPKWRRVCGVCVRESGRTYRHSSRIMLSHFTTDAAYSTSLLSWQRWQLTQQWTLAVKGRIHDLLVNYLLTGLSRKPATAEGMLWRIWKQINWNGPRDRNIKAIRESLWRECIPFCIHLYLCSLSAILITHYPRNASGKLRVSTSLDAQL